MATQDSCILIHSCILFTVHLLPPLTIAFVVLTHKSWLVKWWIWPRWSSHLLVQFVELRETINGFEGNAFSRVIDFYMPSSMLALKWAWSPPLMPHRNYTWNRTKGSNLQPSWPLELHLLRHLVSCALFVKGYIT